MEILTLQGIILLTKERLKMVDINNIMETLPPFTKFYMIGTVVMALCTTFGLLNEMVHIHLEFPLIYKNLQVRPSPTCHDADLEDPHRLPLPRPAGLLLPHQPLRMYPHQLTPLRV